MEGSIPVVFSKEHDDDSEPWVGSGNHGWPVFVDGPFPQFSELSLEPRVALHGFMGIKRRAEKMCDRWKQNLAVDAASKAQAQIGAPEDDPRKERERQLKRTELESKRDAIKWWTFFLARHERAFGSGLDEWSFAVEEIDRVFITGLLPFPPRNTAACPSSMDVSMQPQSSMEVSMEATRPFVARCGTECPSTLIKSAFS
jgi:hypothetical protein